MRNLRIAVLLAGAPLLVAAPPAGSASGCSENACVPRTGTWTAPSPQKLTSSFGPTAMTVRVKYRKNGKIVKSRYGNAVTDLAVYLRYFCDNPNAPWVETGFSILRPVMLKRDGTASVTIPANYAFAEHRLVLKFKRTTFSGRLSGTATSSEGDVCSTSVSFSGRLK